MIVNRQVHFPRADLRREIRQNTALVDPYFAGHEYEKGENVLQSLKSCSRIVLNEPEGLRRRNEFSVVESERVLEELFRRYQYNYYQRYGIGIAPGDKALVQNFLQVNRKIKEMDGCIDAVRLMLYGWQTREEFGASMRVALDQLVDELPAYTEVKVWPIDRKIVLRAIVDFPI